MHREIYHLHPSEGGIGVHNVETRRQTLRFCFLGRMSTKDYETSDFLKKDPQKAYPIKRKVYSSDGETHRLPRNECSCYRECWHDLRVFSRLQTGLSDSRPLSSKALYRTLVKGTIGDELMRSALRRRKATYCGCGSGVEVPQQRRGIAHLAGDSERPLSRPEAVYSGSGAARLRSRSRTPSFTVRSCGRWADFLKATWFAYWMKKFFVL